MKTRLRELGTFEKNTLDGGGALNAVLIKTIKRIYDRLFRSAKKACRFRRIAFM